MSYSGGISGGKIGRLSIAPLVFLFVNLLCPWVPIQAKETENISVVATVPLLPGYAGLIAGHSSIRVVSGVLSVSLREGDGVPVRSRDVVLLAYSDGVLEKEMLLKTDWSGNGAVSLGDFGLDLSRSWDIRCEVVFPDGRVLIVDAAEVSAKDSATGKSKDMALLVLLGGGIYTGRRMS